MNREGARALRRVMSLPFAGRDESAPVSYSVSKLVSALCKKG